MDGCHEDTLEKKKEDFGLHTALLVGYRSCSRRGFRLCGSWWDGPGTEERGVGFGQCLLRIMVLFFIGGTDLTISRRGLGGERGCGLNFSQRRRKLDKRALQQPMSCAGE